MQLHILGETTKASSASSNELINALLGGTSGLALSLLIVFRR